MAHLKTKATTGKPQEREELKWNIVRGLYERGFERAEIIKIFQVIDRMMTLPEELALSFDERLTLYEEERTMPLLSNMELRGMSKGALQNARESVITVLRSRLGEVPAEVTDAISNIDDISFLKQLLERAAVANSFAEFHQFLNSQLNNQSE